MGSFSLSGGVEVFGFISPSDTTDTYPVIDPLYGIDGLRNVDLLSDLDNIPTLRRRAGMVVGISGGTTYYKLNLPPWTNTFSDWSIFNSGGSSGGTMSGDYLPLSGGTVSGGTQFTSGLSANTISATTYQNLPLDIFVTGGTFSGGVITFINNSGGTFGVSGISSFDTFVTGFTYSDNTFTILQNSGSSFSTTIDNVTGLTINGDLIVTGSSTLDGVISSQSLSGSTDRLVQVNSGGTLTAITEVVEAYISSASTVATQLSNISNWDINGNYTGSTINGTFQGQKYYDNNYFFEAVQDNLFIRLIRG